MSNTMEREIICTSCPMGCHITVTMEGTEIVSIVGNTCPRGAAYARAEVTDPRRTITTTVLLSDGGLLPVKSNKALSKKRIPEFLEAVHKVVAERPVTIGEVLLKDIDGEGTDIVATQNAL